MKLKVVGEAEFASQGSDPVVACLGLIGRWENHKDDYKERTGALTKLESGVPRLVDER